MSWYQLEVALRSDELSAAESLLTLSGAEALSISDAAQADILEPEPETTPLWPTVIVKALYRSEPAAAAGRTVIAETLKDSTMLSVQRLSDTEWRETWARRPTKQLIGNRLAIIAADEAWSDPVRVAVRLNLGLAFGTGDHPTTAMCLEWLDANLLSATQVLDYGCGSGVLAIAALRLGATSGWAVDIDRQALQATRENAALNGVTNELWAGADDELPVSDVDVAIANILARPLCELALRLGSLVRPSGYVVLSGILTSQSEMVQEAYAGEFGSFVEQEQDGWVCLAARRL